VCGADLRVSGGTLVCATGHSFDVAREGYCNLLPSQHRTAGVDGDTPDMLQARRRFLEAGHYAPLLDRLTSAVEAVFASREDRHPAPGARTSVIEVGCGEGYYIGGLQARLGGAMGADVSFVGTDLSKTAVRMAARRHPRLITFVSDVNRRVYVRDGSAAVLLDVFAPRNPAEFARILEPRGSALIVIPSPTHLQHLRNELGLLGIQGGKEELVIERLAEQFRLVERAEVEFEMELTAEAANDLVGMGPNRWHRDDEAVPPSGPRRATASFIMLRLELLGS